MRPLSILQILEKGHFNTGSVVQMFQLAENLHRRGHRVAVVSRGDGQIRERCAAAGVDFVALPMRNEFDLASAAKLARVYRERAVDVVHAHKGIAHSVALAATFLGRCRPAIVVNRGVSFPLDAFNRTKFHVRLGAVVTVCEDIKKVIVASGRLRPELVRVIYAGVDLDVFDPEKLDRREVRREWGVADGDFLVVQVGAREWKGWKHLVEATALARPRVPNIRTAIVACKNEEQKAEVAAYAAERGVGDAVLPVGFRYDMPKVLMAADLAVDLSYEGLGVTGTIREAMALGKPVIATAAGGNPELVVDGESGLLVPVKDPAAAAEAIVRVAANPAEAARRARGGRERVEAGFSSKVRVDRIESLYRDLAGADAREAAA
ncbi:MAG TPA: glycosyltransferase [Thermoanaerobaculia bacterium]|nr:glycosyltransferase [Thermoanaerobaculia bacterium]